MDKKLKEQVAILEKQVSDLSEKKGTLEADVCTYQTMYKRSMESSVAKEQELLDLQNKIGFVFDLSKISEAIKEKKKEMDEIDKEIENNKKEKSLFISDLEKVTSDHNARILAKEKELESRLKDFDIYCKSKNEEIENSLVSISDREKYIDVEIGLLSSEKDEIQRQKQVSSTLYSEAQKIKELADKESKKCVELQNKLSVEMEKVWNLQKELWEKNQEYTDKNNLLTKTLSDNLLLKEKNENEKSRLDIELQKTLTKQKEYDESLSKIKEKEKELDESLSKIKSKEVDIDVRIKNLENKERSVQWKEQELIYDDSKYKAKYNQFLLLMSQKWVKL